MKSILLVAFVFGPMGALGFAGLGSQRVSSSSSSSALSMMDRRESLESLASGALAAAGLFSVVAAADPAYAEITDETPRVTTRMGGLLERYQNGGRGWSILAPTGWNRFEGEVGAYDMKWQDLVDPTDNIKVSSTPVKSTTTSITILGDVQELGENLAAKRNAKLVKALERQTDGIVFYQFEFAINDGTHQILSLSVNKGRIWSLDANSTEKRWSKQETLYNNVVGSFVPKLS